MNKIFKGICVFMSLCLIITSIWMFAAVNRSKDNKFSVNFYGSKEIVAMIRNMELNMTSVIYVMDENDEWVEYQRIHGDENRIWIDFDKMSNDLVNSFIAIEDQRFYTHDGVDWKRTFSAFANSYLDFYSSKQGGSTITQQLIKNVTKDNEKTKDRKIREIFRAIAIETELEKEEILEAYLNTISLGNGICGVEVAANYYFNKSANELSLLECASIAAITKHPTKYNPIANPEENKKRRNTVLQKMAELGMITQSKCDELQQQDITLDDSRRTALEQKVNSYFVDALIDDVISDLQVKYNCSENVASTMFYNGGFKIYATVDLEIQSIIEKVYSEVKKYFPQIAKVKENKGNHVQSAMTITDYQGHIVGIVGGVGEKTRNRGLNRATDSHRQPGSTMKPLGVYAPALENGTITPYTYEIDSPIDNYYGAGKPGPAEWYGYYAGSMTVAKAIERSANTIPCKILQRLGIDTSYNFLTQSLGLKSLVEEDKNIAALALGGTHKGGITTTESAAAYAIFGNNGKYFEPTTYYKIERVNGELILGADTIGKQVIKPATATIMNEMLQAVVHGSSGTGTKIRSYSKMRAYAKTGTSSDCNDLWMVAGTPYYVGAVWYGFDLQEEVYNTSAAANVWLAVMKEVHKDLEVKEFVLNEEFETQKYCKSTGLLAGKKCTWTGEGRFIPGVEIAVCDGKHKWVESDKNKDTSQPETPSDSSNTSSTTSTENSSTSSTGSEQETSSNTSTEGGGGSSDVTPKPPTDSSGPEDTSHQ